MFDQRHKPDVVVRWPAQPPTNSRHHRAEGVEMFKTFPDNKVHYRPYKTFFASGDWTCSIARFTGTMKGPLIGARLHGDSVNSGAIHQPWEPAVDHQAREEEPHEQPVFNSIRLWYAAVARANPRKNKKPPTNSAGS